LGNNVRSGVLRAQARWFTVNDGMKTICWCGTADLIPFSEHYLRCTSCNTLVSTGRMPDDFYSGSDSGGQLYGKQYWFEHVKNLGTPDIVERARMDLVERDIYWARDILRYKLPPARSLELGCCHGGSVYLMQLAGFDATGTEMSRWLCDYAHETFRIPMLCGALERLDLPSGSFDIVTMFDVLEHLLDPLGGLQKLAGITGDDGIVVIQTPECIKLDRSYQELLAENERFLLHLKEEEHLYLFNKESITRLLNQAGFPYVRFEPAIFDYDMFVVAGKRPLQPNDKEVIESCLQESPSGRAFLALMDLHAQLTHCRHCLHSGHAELMREIEVLRGRLDSASDLARQQIFETTSWKVTAPFRWVGDRLRAILK
jgi:2-polyprenyl-3-methyl-5-hydroxy-6-metoxy-1,4-benzoquinol methylase